MNKKLRIIISGGGTAGHIYPALAVARQLRDRGHEILFVGARGKMEMERVPAAGFQIVGLPIVGLQRRLTIRNLTVPFKLVRSLYLARKVISDFEPDVAVGFGGYASAPILKAAARAGVPTVLQEQNSYAGLTNRMLAKEACRICTAYDGMDRFFPKEKIVLTGNPLMINPVQSSDRAQAYSHFGLSEGKKTVLVTGGSLGTRTLNEAVMALLEKGDLTDKVQIIWQTGKYYYDEFTTRLSHITHHRSHIAIRSFIDRMDMAYAAADVVVCRAGASTVSELELLGKAAIFVPSPNVAEDHQTKNAQALVDIGAAMMVPDHKAVKELFDNVFELLGNQDMVRFMEQKIKTLGKPNATNDVVAIVESCAINYNSHVPSPKPHIYFIGIGGIGMSALARFFKHEGYRVAGYDRTQTALTDSLEKEGISVHYDDSELNIPEEFRSAATTVIYTPAVPDDSAELSYFRANGNEVIKRSRALGKLAEGKYLQAVAGTHGKTTTSTMAAWFNSVAAAEGSAFLGGISKNFATNMVLSVGDRMVVEADEFDRSFLQLHPSAAVITAADPDHLDIYGTEDEFRRGFEQFITQIKPHGRVVVKKGVDLTVENPQIAVLSYSLDDPATDYYAKNIQLLEGGYYAFDIVTPSRTINACTLGIPGLINVENCVAAVSLIDSRPINDHKLREAIASFEGVARRFDFHVNSPRVVYMDDYAHHPRELTAMLKSVRNMFPERHVTIAFQPHLYTRTRDFYVEFAEALSLADHVILLPIYPAREEPIEGVSAAMIHDLVTVSKELLNNKEQLIHRLSELELDVFITAGAGNIDTLIAPVRKRYKRESS